MRHVASRTLSAARCVLTRHWSMYLAAANDAQDLCSYGVLALRNGFFFNLIQICTFSDIPKNQFEILILIFFFQISSQTFGLQSLVFNFSILILFFSFKFSSKRLIHNHDFLIQLLHSTSIHFVPSFIQEKMRKKNLKN